MFAGLSASLESSLEFASSSVDHEQSHIGLTSAGNHVRDEVLVARRVQQGERPIGSLEVGSGDVYCHASGNMPTNSDI